MKTTLFTLFSKTKIEISLFISSAKRELHFSEFNNLPYVILLLEKNGKRLEIEMERTETLLFNQFLGAPSFATYGS
jgi:hypothetical protein